VRKSVWVAGQSRVLSDSQQRQTDRRGQLAGSSSLIYEITCKPANLATPLPVLLCPIRSVARTNDCPLVYVYIQIAYKTPSFLPLIGLRLEILPVVLYGCETWSVTLREDYRLRLLEKRVLRRIFGPKRSKLRGEGRKLHNECLMICTAHPVLLGW